MAKSWDFYKMAGDLFSILNDKELKNKKRVCFRKEEDW